MESDDFVDAALLDHVRGFLLVEELRDSPAHEGAWRRFYAWADRTIRQFANRYVASQQDLDDCAQEVWVQVIRGLLHFELDTSKGRFRTWLFRVVRDASISYFRQQHRNRCIKIFDQRVQESSPHEADPAAVLERRESPAQLQSMLGRIRPQVSGLNYQLLHMRWLQGMTVTEVATALQLQPQGVWYREHRLRRKLRQVLKDYEREVVAPVEAGPQADARALVEAHSRGIASIWLVLVLIALMAFFALGVDIMHVVRAGQQMQAGADASALAAAMEVRNDVSIARDQALNLAAANRVVLEPIQLARNDNNGDLDGDVVIGRFNRETGVFTPIPPGTGLPNAARVIGRRTSGSLGGPLSMLFGTMFGVNTVDLDRRATAIVGGGIGAGVIALNPTQPCTFEMRGSTALFELDNGALYVNSNHDNAACHSGRPDMNAGEIFVVGGLDQGFESQVNYGGETYTGVEPIPDPLAALPEPNPPAVNRGNVKVQNGSRNLQPGQYDKLELLGGSTTMAPGLYYINDLFAVGGNANLDASAGVMIFIGPNARLNMDGTGQVTLNPMSPTDYPNGPSVPSDLANIGVPVFQSRSNSREAVFRGTNDWTLSGTIYIPGGHMSVGGTMSNFANGLIADTIEIFGTGTIRVDYQDQFTRVERFVFLVE